MSVIINGDTGISGVNGSAANPAVKGEDADTGIHFGADTAAITTGGTDKVSIDSSGDTTFSGTVKTSKVENANTSNGGLAIDATGHVTVDGIQAPTDGQVGHRNLLINGDMRISQRSTSAENNRLAFNANPAYDTLDRWGFWASNPDRFTSQQVVDAPPGHYNSIKITSLTAHTFGGSHAFTVTQRIEAQNLYGTEIGTASAKTYTISFWVKSSLTGTFSIYALNGGFIRSFVSEYTISAANTWEYKTINIAAPTDSAFNAVGNARQLEVGFSLGAGSGFSMASADLDAWQEQHFMVNSANATKLLETNGATIQFTGVQLEVGDRATPFEHTDIGDELARCYRYFELMRPADRTLGKLHALSQAHFTVEYKRTKRATPSVISDLSNASQIFDGTTDKVNGANGVTFTYQSDGISIDSVTFRVNVSPAFTGAIYRPISGYGMTIAIDAEL